MHFVIKQHCFISTHIGQPLPISRSITARAMLTALNGKKKQIKAINTAMPLMLTDFWKYITDITFSQSWKRSWQDHKDVRARIMISHGGLFYSIREWLTVSARVLHFNTTLQLAGGLVKWLCFTRAMNMWCSLSLRLSSWLT